MLSQLCSCRYSTLLSQLQHKHTLTQICVSTFCSFLPSKWRLLCIGASLLTIPLPKLLQHPFFQFQILTLLFQHLPYYIGPPASPVQLHGCLYQSTRTTQVKTYTIFNHPGYNCLYFIYSYDNIVLWLRYTLFQKKKLKKKFFHIEFLTKKSARACVYLPLEWSQGLER